MGALAVCVALLACAQEDGPAAEAPRERWTVEAFSEELPCGTGGIEVDAHGNVYVGDFGSKLGPADGERQGGDRVFRIDPAGAVSVFARGLRGASGNALGPGGDLFQSSIGGDTITRITPAGEASLFLTRGLRAPVGIAIDAEGMLFVANCGSNSVVEVSPAGEVRELCSSPLLACPNGIALGPEHELYVANFGDGNVIRIDWEGQASVLATLPGNNNGHLIWHDGFLYVVARGAHRIFRVAVDGTVTPFAGSGPRGAADGPALEATFSFPNDIVVAPDGKSFYVNQPASTTAPHTELAPTLVRRIRLASARAR
jgi:sugar lactone lactonase YvrE